jgi:hypothetical protein
LFKWETIRVSADNRVRTISDERTLEHVDGMGRRHWIEAGHCAFGRMSAPGEGVAAGRMKTRCTHGVLTARPPEDGADRARSMGITGSRRRPCRSSEDRSW